VTVGGIFDQSQEQTYQTTYDSNGVQNGEVLASENAMNLYFLARYKKDLGADNYFTLEDFCRRIQDNIPNHTQGFYIDRWNDSVHYNTIVDHLDYRDVFTNAFRAEFSMVKNRGFNFSTAGKYEFSKHFPHTEFNYPEAAVSSLILVNKCEYIYLLPFLKDMFLIPKYKNVFEFKNVGNAPDTLNARYRRDNLAESYKRNSLANTAYLVCEWNITYKTALTTGLELTKFDDFNDNGENFYEPCFSTQLRIKDRYKGYALVLTLGYSRYAYIYDHPGKLHSPFNNPRKVEDNIDDHKIFVKVHCGFM
jgi:hypothetical protein